MSKNIIEAEREMWILKQLALRKANTNHPVPIEAWVMLSTVCIHPQSALGELLPDGCPAVLHCRGTAPLPLQQAVSRDGGELGYEGWNNSKELQHFVTVAFHNSWHLPVARCVPHCVRGKKRWQWRTSDLVNFFQTQIVYLLFRKVIWILDSSVSVWRPQIFQFMPAFVW